MSEARLEAAARALASIEPGEDWPTNEALGGSLTGTRDDEYRDGMRMMAKDALDAADSVDPIREALQAAEAALAEQRATNARLNRRAQIAEAAVNGFTNNGMRQGLRSDRILAEYWQRAEDARAELAALKAVTR